MFGRSLKKQQKLEALLKLTGDVTGKRCLLITCGDNNGALNYFFRAHGGRWAWGDVVGENLAEMSTLLGEPVYHIDEAAFPFAAGSHDCVVAIDVLEHLASDQPFLAEVRRVLRPGGRGVITVPNGDPKLLANRIKWRVGMTPAMYGHTRAGYTVPELQGALRRASLRPVASGGYSRFFTEMVELTINFGYTRVLSRKQGRAAAGHIAPASSGELKRHGAAYQVYSLLFPAMRLVSKLDGLLPAGDNGAVIVVARKPEGVA
jgi:SAM-dependent methyltransferase